MKHTNRIRLAATIALHLISGSWLCLPAAALENLQPLEGWQQVAPGVWKAQIGDADKELAV